jgi:hypothetical protein
LPPSSRATPEKAICMRHSGEAKTSLTRACPGTLRATAGLGRKIRTLSRGEFPAARAA